jgi:FkbM family methyltransferase
MLTDTVYRSMRPWKELQKQFKRVLVRLPHRKRVVKRFGQHICVDPSELHGFYLYYEREYDDHIFKFLASQLSLYRRALDLGANIGVYTLFLAAYMERVDAFEPEPLVVEKLRANLLLNGLRNVVVHEACVGNVSGEIGFDPPCPSNEGIGKVSTAPAAACLRRCITLDEFLGDQIKEPLFIKIDVEGAEWLVLQAAQVLFRPKLPVAMLIEIHPEEIKRFGGSTDQLCSHLVSMGYAVNALTVCGLQPLGSNDFRFWWVTSHDHSCVDRSTLSSG